MLKIFLCVTLCVTLFAAGESVDLLNRIQRTTTSEITTESSAKNTVPDGYFKVNNIPQVEKDCQIKYYCKKKLKTAETPKPCIKFCVRSIECTHSKSMLGLPGQCLELNEEMVTQEYNDCKRDEQGTYVHPMPVAMIDFPCQPGYLPDSRGRCREVW